MREKPKEEEERKKKRIFRLTKTKTKNFIGTLLSLTKNSCRFYNFVLLFKPKKTIAFACNLLCVYQTKKKCVRHSTSPKKHHDPYNPSTSTSNSKYPPECKPNINDLRQLFDSSRYEYKRNVNPGQAQSYYDAKTSAADENILETKIGLTRNIDFERAKQKFDKPTSLRLNKIHQVKPTNYTKSGGYSGGMRTNQSDSVGKKHASDGSKKDAYMNSSMNLDELKVSDDDVSKKLIELALFFVVHVEIFVLRFLCFVVHLLFGCVAPFVVNHYAC